MKNRGWDWPNLITNPGAFLESRLRKLSVRPEGAQKGGVTAARLDAAQGRASVDGAATSRETADADAQRWHAAVQAVTTAEDREVVLRAHEAKIGPLQDPIKALAGAGRRAMRLYPDLELGAAVIRWAGDVLAQAPAKTVTPQRMAPARTLRVDVLMDLAIADCECLVCGGAQASPRPQLPLKSMVCDQCWPVIAAELDEASDIEEMQA